MCLLICESSSSSGPSLHREREGELCPAIVVVVWYGDERGPRQEIIFKHIYLNNISVDLSGSNNNDSNEMETIIGKT